MLQGIGDRIKIFQRGEERLSFVADELTGRYCEAGMRKDEARLELLFIIKPQKETRGRKGKKNNNNLHRIMRIGDRGEKSSLDENKKHVLMGKRTLDGLNG